MNFFGHAAVATWRGEGLDVAFGAMLPDFATIIQGRFEEPVKRATIQRGVDLHHKTDAVFHASRSFLDLSRVALTTATERGMRRGPARAFGHVAIEMLLDRVWARNEEILAAYRNAVLATEIDTITWRTNDESDRFAALINRLRDRVRDSSASRSNVSVDDVVHRLRAALSVRPRLAMDDRDVGIAFTLAHELAKTVEARAEEVRTETLGALNASQ